MAGDDILIRIEGNEAEFRASMKSAENILRDSTRKMQTSLNGIDKSFSSVTKGLSAFKGALAFTGVTVGFDQIRKSIESVGAIAETAEKIGLTSEKLQELNFTASQNASSSEAMTAGLQKFNQSIGEAAAGTGEFKDVVKAYGIQLKDAQGNTRSTYDILLDLSDIMAGIQDPTERARIAVDAFGRGGRDLITTLSLGREGFKQFAQTAQDTGQVLSNDVTKRAQELNDKFNALSDTITNKLKKAIVEAASALDKLLNPSGNFVWGDDLKAAREEAQRLREELEKLPTGGQQNFIDASKLRGKISGLEAVDPYVALAKIQKEIGELEAKNFNAESVQGRTRAAQLSELIAKETALRLEIERRDKKETKTGTGGSAPVVDKEAEAAAKKIKAVIEDLTLQYDNLGRTAREAAIATALDKAGVADGDAAAQQIKDLAGAYYDAALAAKEFADAEAAYDKRQMDQESARLDIDKYISDLQKQNEILKEGTEIQAGLTAVAEQEQKAREAGIELTEQQKESIRGLADENAKLKESQEAAKEAARDLGSAISTAFEDAVVNGKSATDVMKGLLQDIEKMILRILVTKPMEAAMSSLLGSAGSGLMSLFGFADGGVMSSQGPMPLRKYASGGIANSPQMAVFGEGRMNEAFVPLPDGRSIPVTMKSGGDAGTVINQSVTVSGNGVTYADVKKAMEISKAETIQAIGQIQKRKGSSRIL